MTLTTFQSLFLSVMLIIAACFVLPSCGLLGEPGRAPLWETQNRQSH